MPRPKKLVCFVEGKGDWTAVPNLARRVLSEIGATDVLIVDDDTRGPYHVQGLGKLLKRERSSNLPNWQRWLMAAGLDRSPLGGVLLVLDGDESKPLDFWGAYTQRFRSAKFCARDAARLLAMDARMARAGEAFSVSVAFAVKEFESWLLAGIESLRGQVLADGTPIPADAAYPVAMDVEQERDAKGLLRRIVPTYSETDDQGALARSVDLTMIHKRSRSFQRFWHACEELANAVRTGSHISTPVMLDPPQ